MKKYKFETRNIHYKEWLATGLLDDMEVEDKLKLATLLSDGLRILKLDFNSTKDFERHEDAMFLLIIRRLFLEGRKELDVKEVYDKLNKFYETVKYKELKEELKSASFNYQVNGSLIDVEAELVTYIVENYENI